jgi:glycosyltransferase involved in cell wall biosynthesis
VTLDLSRSDEEWSVSCELIPVVRVRAWHLERFGTVVAPGFTRVLERVIIDGDIQLVHDHGLWLQTNHGASVMADTLGIPLIAAPRGTLEPWSRRHKRWKKRLAWTLYQKRALQLAKVLHATSCLEARGFRDMGLNQPIAVLPNGVDSDVIAPEIARGGSNGHVALFLSRIHPKKGVLDLVEAWSEIKPNGWTLLVVGPDEAGHRASVEAAARARGLGTSFQIRGPAYGDDKRALLERADLFVLPTLSENFGNVVVEALAAGTPVITTRAAPWGDLEKYHCGWWIDVGPKSLAEALAEATRRPPSELAAMGRRGQRLVRQKYTWERIAEQALQVYAWMIGIGPRPANVIADRVTP